MNRIIRKTCAFCQHEKCEEFEELLSSGETTALDLEKEQGWSPNIAQKHLDHHAPGHHSQPNDRCVLCTSPYREEYELKLRNGEFKTSELADHLGCSIKTIQNHIRNHLKPAVQKSAALLIAQRDIDEIGVLTENVELIRNKIDELLHETDLSFKQIDALTKLAKEVRESLKYLLEFKGKLIHRREETVIIKQVEIIQRVLLDKYPDVWANIRNEIEEQLQ
jgi:hypothetical protein